MRACSRAPLASVLFDMIGFAAQRLMELDAGSVTGAAHGERNWDHQGQHNHTSDREWETRAGTIELHILKLRKGSPDASPCAPCSVWGGWHGIGCDHAK